MDPSIQGPTGNSNLYFPPNSLSQGIVPNPLSCPNQKPGLSPVTPPSSPDSLRLTFCWSDHFHITWICPLSPIPIFTQATTIFCPHITPAFQLVSWSWDWWFPLDFHFVAGVIYTKYNSLDNPHFTNHIQNKTQIPYVLWDSWWSSPCLPRHHTQHYSPALLKSLWSHKHVTYPTALSLCPHCPLHLH